MSLKKGFVVRFGVRFLVWIGVFFSSSGLTYAQRATLSGTVTDQKGGAIPSVTITLVNVDQGLKREATTNDEGYFTIPLLQPGWYVLTAQKEGFTAAEIKDVILHVGDQVNLAITLKLGPVSEKVTVEGGAPLVNTQDGSVSTVVNRQFVENMPLNGRSFQTLVSLTPGVVLTRADVNNQGQFSVNGQRADANYFTIDGVSANINVSLNIGLTQSASGSLPGFSVSGGTNNLVSVDALQEFRIQTSTFAPEFGRTPGGQVSIVTRSGTNEVHGTLFDYFRNDALDANDWFANSRGIPKPALRQNDFGGVLGGPVLKNRTFFFFSYEGLRLRQPQTTVTTVPSAGTRQTAVARIQPFLNAYPISNGTDFRNGTAEFAASFSNPVNLNATSIRVDHTINRRLTAFARYNYSPSEIEQRGSGTNTLSNLTFTRLTTQTLTAGVAFVAGPRVTDDFRANWSRMKGDSLGTADSFGGAAAIADSLVFPASLSRQDSSFSLGISNLTRPFYGVGTVADNLQRQINLINSMSAVSGDHQLKFGIDYRRLSPILGIRKYSQFALFSSVSQAITGIVPSGFARSNASQPTLILNNYSLFGQDAWRITSHLTLTYGLRWDVNPPPKAEKGSEPFAVTGLDSPGNLALAPRGTPLYKTTYDNIAPRVGVAYQLSQRQGREVVIRGGFGIFYDLGNQRSGQAVTEGNFPYSATNRFGNVPFPLDPALAAPPSISLNPPFGSMVVFDPNLKLPRTYQWNLAIERSLGANQTVSASYVAAVGRRLQRREQLRQNPSPNFTFVSAIRNNATSDYHALQLQFQRRLSRGLQALASYTWSHSIDDASNDDTDNDRTRSSSNFDIRHAFTGAISYNLPQIGRAGFAEAIFGHWSLDTIMRASSAAPVNVIATTFVTLGGVIQNIRPDLIAGMPLYINDPSAPGGRRINRAAFAIPPATPARQGTLGRNALRGFPVSQVDLALRRQFHLTERVNLQVRTEFFNLFNHPNFGDPVNTLTGSLFGLSTEMFGRSLGSGGTNGGLSPLYQVGGPRSIQFALKLLF